MKIEYWKDLQMVWNNWGIIIIDHNYYHYLWKINLLIMSFIYENVEVDLQEVWIITDEHYYYWMLYKLYIVHENSILSLFAKLFLIIF